MPKFEYNFVKLIPEYLKIQIPQNWTTEFLENMLTQSISYGILLHDDNPDGIPIVTSAALEKSDGIKKNLIYVSKEIEEKFKRTRLNGGEILISLVGYTGNIAVAPIWCKGFNVTRHVGVIRLKNEYFTNYFAYLLQSRPYQRKISAMTIGSAQPVINLRDLSKFIMIIPSINEQQKIASILSNVDDLISSYDSIIETTKKLKIGLMQTLLTKGIGHKKFKKVKWLFGKEIEIPEIWTIEKITNVGDEFGDSPFGSLLKSDDYTEHGVPVLQGRNIKNNRFIWEQKTFVSEEKFLSLKRNHCNVGDLVFQKIGTVGAVAIIPKLDDHDTYVLSTNMMKMSVNKTIADVNFLYYLFVSNEMQKVIQSIVRGNVQSIFNFTSLKKLKVLNPPLNEQQKIVDVLSNIDSKLNEIKSKKSNLETIKKGLMQKLLTGQIRVKV